MKEKNYIPKSNGFKIPKNYLEDFSVVISQTETPSALINQKDHGFKTPASYFENFKVEIPQQETKVIPLYKKKIFTAVASVAAVIVFIILIYKNDQTSIISSNKNLSTLAIEKYLEQSDFDFENDEFYFNSNQNSTIQTELKNVDNDAILEYLANNTDMATLLNDE